MKKILTVTLCLIAFVFMSGFSADDFNIDNLDRYEKEYKTEELELCSTSSTKTYEPYTAITSPNSAQYKLIQTLTIDETTGFLYDEDGFIAAALAYGFGPIGSRFYFTLDTGIVIPIIKADAKAAEHAPNGCSAGTDASVIEFIIAPEISREYFGQGPSGLASYGNFNNYEGLKGNIAKIERVLDEKVEEGIHYEDEMEDVESEKHSDEGYHTDLVTK